MVTINITKEITIATVIETFGVANRLNIEEMINIFHWLRLSGMESEEQCYVHIGFLYSALRDMEFHSQDLPLFLN
jgi:hypothetical protein